LEEAFERFREKYRGVTVDPYHLIRSLSYFAEAEAQPMPEMLQEITWEAIKAFFRAEATHRLRELP
jgi:hypothetical protein